MRIQSSGHNRVLVAFDLSNISTANLVSATLVMTIAENSDNWGKTGIMKIERGMRLFFRGMLGGIAGNSLKAMVAWLLYSFVLHSTFGYFGNATTFLLFAIVGIPAAALAGGMIGIIIGAISAARGRNIGVIGRALIGASFVGCLTLIMIAYDKLSPDVNRWSYKPSTWMIASLFYVDFGLIIGAVAGIIVGHQNPRK